VSNRSSEAGAQNAIQLPFRDASNSLVPVEEREIEAELEQKWYTLEEQVQEGMMKERDGQQSS